MPLKHSLQMTQRPPGCVDARAAVACDANMAWCSPLQASSLLCRLMDVVSWVLH